MIKRVRRWKERKGRGTWVTLCNTGELLEFSTEPSLLELLLVNGLQMKSKVIGKLNWDGHSRGEINYTNGSCDENIFFSSWSLCILTCLLFMLFLTIIGELWRLHNRLVFLTFMFFVHAQLYLVSTNESNLLVSEQVITVK